MSASHHPLAQISAAPRLFTRATVAKLTLGLVLAALLGGCMCIHRPGKIHPDEGDDRERKAELIGKKFTRVEVPVGQHRWTVLQQVKDRNAPAVLILHELPALSERTLQLADRIADRGYNVYVPLLFGKMNDNANSTWLGISRAVGFVVGQRDWRANASGERAITRQLVAFAKAHVLDNSRTTPLAVIGLCLTGPLPLQMMGQPEDFPQLVAPVLSQPSLPIVACSDAAKRSIGLAESELQRAQDRAMQVLYFRFKNDPISPQERLDAFKVRFGSKLLPVTIDPSSYGPNADHGAHAVLTDGFQKWEAGEPEPPGYYPFRVLIGFLDDRLLRSADYTLPTDAPPPVHAAH